MKKLFFLIVSAALFVSACGGGIKAPDTNALSTQIAATVNAALNVVIPTSAPNAVPTKAPIVPPPAATKAPANNGGSGISFSAITFAIGQDNDNPIDALDTFPDGITTIYALFDGVNVPSGLAWQSQWFKDGKVITSPKDHTWSLQPNEVDWITFGSTDNSAMDPGVYELRLTIDSQVVQTGQFTVVQNGEPDFGPIMFAGGVDSNDKAVDPVDSGDPTFASGTTEVYAFWSAMNVPSDTPYTREWYKNGKLVQSKDDTWGFGPTDENWVSFASTDNTKPLAPGTYELKLIIDGTTVDIGMFIVSEN